MEHRSRPTSRRRRSCESPCGERDFSPVIQRPRFGSRPAIRTTVELGWAPLGPRLPHGVQFAVDEPPCGDSCVNCGALALLACFCALPSRSGRRRSFSARTRSSSSLSERVVHGRVVAQRTTQADRKGRRFTRSPPCRSSRTSPASTATPSKCGSSAAVIGDEFLYVGGAVRVSPRRGSARLPRARTAGTSQRRDGLLEVRRAARGQRRAPPAPQPPRHRRSSAALVAREPSLSEFRALASSVTGRPPRRGRAPQRWRRSCSRSSQPFTFLGPLAMGAGGLGNAGDLVHEHQRAQPAARRRRRQRDPDVAVRVDDSRVGVDHPSIRRHDVSERCRRPVQRTGFRRSGVITFEDPEQRDQRLDARHRRRWVGGSAAPSTARRSTASSRGYVIFQNAADLSTSFRQSPNYTRVLTHEIGHAIGLGHTRRTAASERESNIMYPSCCVGRDADAAGHRPRRSRGSELHLPVRLARRARTRSTRHRHRPRRRRQRIGHGSTQAGCGWTASSNTGFLGISSGSSGSGSGTRRLQRCRQCRAVDALGHADGCRPDVHGESGGCAVRATR